MSRHRHAALVSRAGLSLLAAGLVTFCPTATRAQTTRAGVVTALEGNVTATRGSAPRAVALKFKDEVLLKDRITTGERSFTRLLLGGKAVVTVRERSMLTITEMPGLSTIELESGKIGLAVTRDRMRPGDRIQVRTPNVIAGVRGTVMVVEVSRVSAQAGPALPAVLSTVALLQGSGEVQQIDSATGQPIGALRVLKVRERFRVTGGVPGPMETLTDAEAEATKAGLSPSGPPYQGAANADQVKENLMRITAALLDAPLATAPTAELIVAAPPVVRERPTAPINPPFLGALAAIQGAGSELSLTRVLTSVGK
jgi:hypothetical protein